MGSNPIWRSIFQGNIMAVVITKRGQLPEKKRYHGKCHYCKTEIDFLAEDATVRYDQRDGNYLMVECPVCVKPITVKK